MKSDDWNFFLSKAKSLPDDELIGFEWTSTGSPAMVNNKEGAQECVSCTSPAPGQSAKALSIPAFIAPSPAVAPAAPTFNFAAAGFQPKKATGWSCSVCMVNNKEGAQECVSCTSPAPGQSAKALSIPAFIAPSPAVAPAAPTFNFAAAGFQPKKLPD